jgi:hypothetical protein
MTRGKRREQRGEERHILCSLFMPRKRRYHSAGAQFRIDLEATCQSHTDSRMSLSLKAKLYFHAGEMFREEGRGLREGKELKRGYDWLSGRSVLCKTQWKQNRFASKLDL